MDNNEKMEYIKLCLRVQESSMKIKEKYVSHEISDTEAYKMIDVYRKIASEGLGYSIIANSIDSYLLSVKDAIKKREEQKVEGFSR